jgi:chitinase
VVDAIIVMTFDYHGTQDDKTTGENSPLYASSADTDPNANCDASINNWLNSGADPSKLILGLGFYGHVFELTDPEQHALGSPANGANADYTSYYEVSIFLFKNFCKNFDLKYFQICQLTDGWTEEWDDEQEVPYKYSNTQWIGYDNSQSIKLKVGNARF